MNTNKIQPAHTPTESCMIYAASEWNNEHLLAINSPMTYLSLSTALSTIDVMPVIQQDQTTLTGQNARQSSDQKFQQSREQQLQGHSYRLTGPKYSGRQNNHQQSTLDGINESMDDEYNHAFLEMYDLEKFYADERWKKEPLTESEQLLLVEQLQSLINDAPISSHLCSIRKIQELKYYNLLKILELIHDDIEQSENIEIATTAIEKNGHQQNNGH